MNYKLRKPETTVEEDDIMTGLHESDQRALNAFFELHRTGATYFAMQFIKDRQVAEDIVAECFTIVWERRKDFDCFLSAKSFLYTSVKNACFDELRQFNRHVELHKEIEYLSEKTEEMFSAQRIKSELIQRIWTEIEFLPPVRKQIFRMIYLEGMSTMQIAEALQISVDTVRVQKARALQMLKGIISEKISPKMGF